MPKKQGKCINIDCDNYKQIVEVETGEEFECPLCHQHLEEAGGKSGKDTNKPNGGPNKGIIAAAVAAVAAIGAGAFFMFSGGSEIAMIKLDKDSLKLDEGNTGMLVASVVDKDGKQIEDAEVTFIWGSNNAEVASVANGQVTAAKEGTTEVTVKITDNDKVPAASCKVEVNKVEKAEKVGKGKKSATTSAGNPAYGTVNLGYGTYTGDLKNGKPHGHGTITYKTSRKVVSWQDYVAEPGDKYEGDFRDGAINGLGYLKTRDGNVIAIQ